MKSRQKSSLNSKLNKFSLAQTARRFYDLKVEMLKNLKNILKIEGRKLKIIL